MLLAEWLIHYAAQIASGQRPDRLYTPRGARTMITLPSQATIFPLTLTEQQEAIGPLDPSRGGEYMPSRTSQPLWLAALKWWTV